MSYLLVLAMMTTPIWRDAESIRVVDNTVLVADDHTGDVWDTATSTSIFHAPYAFRDLEALAWDPDTRRLFVFSGDNANPPHLWIFELDLNHNVTLLEEYVLHQEYESACFIDGRLMVTSGSRLFEFDLNVMGDTVLIKNYNLGTEYFYDMACSEDRGFVFTTSINKVLFHHGTIYKRNIPIAGFRGIDFYGEDIMLSGGDTQPLYLWEQ